MGRTVVLGGVWAIVVGACAPEEVDPPASTAAKADERPMAPQPTPEDRDEDRDEDLACPPTAATVDGVATPIVAVSAVDVVREPYQTLQLYVWLGGTEPPACEELLGNTGFDPGRRYVVVNYVQRGPTPDSERPRFVSASNTAPAYVGISVERQTDEATTLCVREPATLQVAWGVGEPAHEVTLVGTVTGKRCGTRKL
jgi:hypothetical protein